MSSNYAPVDRRRPSGVFAPSHLTLSRLYAEFAPLYVATRCPDAPENPLRAFNLAFRIGREFDHRLYPEQFLALVYDTLGYPGSLRPGLFETFDVNRYSAGLPPEEHFLNLFGVKLRGKLLNIIEKARNQPQRLPALGGGRYSPEWQWAKKMLPVFIDCLSPREQEVVRLVFWEGLSFREAGVRLGCDHKAVGRLHDEAVDNLRRMFDLRES